MCCPVFMFSRIKWVQGEEIVISITWSTTSIDCQYTFFANHRLDLTWHPLGHHDALVH
ncbi:hypothetical protein ASPCADRAFT_206538 [Aspergillus carbonarius ITEM 5010]|uniref:Uncharacterized protein n=1 Tax=Aspergillus carbonarius (strain ITEM 5010) TaxID=602072 RepID=A0A1R3RPE7_ASPC5|nr:hypothetical protein ASPCADRAFT_206538 [Aspergillus carbonarius ITEM 5010]